jgi:hypothetical protein
MSKRQQHCRALRNGEFRDHLSENERDALGKLTQRYTKPKDVSPSIDTKSRSSKSHRAHPFVAHKPLKFTQKPGFADLRQLRPRTCRKCDAVIVENDCGESGRRFLEARKDARLDFELVVVVIGGPERPDDRVKGSGTAGDTHGDRGGHPKGLATEQDRRIVDGEVPLADEGRSI